MAIKTRQQLLDYWNSKIIQNSNQAITGQIMNVGGVDIIDSMAMGTDTQANMKWKGRWAQGTYEQYDVVTDGIYLSIANTQTTDRPAPQEIGAPEQIYPTDPTWADNNYTGTVWSGVRLLPPLGQLYQVTNIRLWLTDVSNSAHYRLIIENDITGELYVGFEFDGDVLQTPGWFDYRGDPFFVEAGGSYSFYLVAYNSAGTTDFNHPWVWIGTSNQENDPGAGNIETNNGRTTLRINNTDDDGTPRATELGNVLPGTIIRVAEEANLANYDEYQVNTVVGDLGGYYNYSVSLVDVGGAGAGTGERCQVYFQIPISQPAQYSAAGNYFLNNPNIRGLLAFDSGDPTVGDDGYGIDLTFQEFTVSAEWDIMAVSGGDGGGGSGWIPYYVFTKVTNLTITATQPAWEEVARVDYDIIAGDIVLEYKLSVTYTYPSATNRSAYLRFSIDNGSTWTEFISEPKDVTDKTGIYYAFPINYNESALVQSTFILEASREGAGDTFLIEFADVMVERVR